MQKRTLNRAITSALATGTAIALTAGVTPATAAEPGTTSLVEVLNADGDKFDKNWSDFDIVQRAVVTVLGAKPESAVGVLADGSQALTAFVPTDRAFRKLATELTGEKPAGEKATFKALAAAVPDVDTLEAVLLYHVVPGATITYKQAKQADGAELTTASGGTITVKVTGKGRVVLKDADTDDTNPRVIVPLRNINKGNLQIAHGIDRVLRPIDLP